MSREKLKSEDVLAQMKQYRLPDGEKARLQEISRALDSFDFDAITDALGSIDR
ncbi:MAG: hypothetical protein VZQ83_06870 [Eubacterium sp.]|nr:hypothetical protein [Eubacterium sp.]